MLTRKQHDLLLFIDARLRADGISPSFEEMKEALDLKSKSGIHRLINALVERGFIKRLTNRARALEVLRMPDQASPLRRSAEPAVPAMASNVVSLSERRAAVAPMAAPNLFMELPLHGRIAAGTPIEALERSDSHVAIPATMIGRGDHYALEIDGDSMVDEGILDGDTIIVQKVTTAQNNDIVVALIDDNEATLKRFQLRDGMVHLIPANKAYQTKTYQPPRVRVQGKLVGLLRKY
jgi:repressor LexA